MNETPKRKVTHSPSPTLSSSSQNQQTSSSQKRLPPADMLKQIKPGQENAYTHEQSTPRNIRLVRYTPNNKIWKKERNEQDFSSPIQRQTLTRVPPHTISSESCSKRANNDVERTQMKKRALNKASDARLMDLLRSKSTIGNFHNVTLNKSDMTTVPRSQNMVAEFISANNTARVRSGPFSEAAGGNGPLTSNIGNLLNDSTPSSSPRLNSRRTFTSNVRELLQGAEPATPKSASVSMGDLKSQIPPKDKPDNGTKKDVIDKKVVGVRISSILNEDDQGAFNVARTHVDDKVNEEHKSGLKKPHQLSDIKKCKESHDSGTGLETSAENVNEESSFKTVFAQKRRIQDEEEDEKFKERSGIGKEPIRHRVPSLAEKIQEKCISHEQSKHLEDLQDEKVSGNKQPCTSNSQRSEKSGTEESEELEANASDTTLEKERSVSLTKSQELDAQHVGSVEGKWIEALKQEPSNSESQRQVLANLFSSVYKSNLRSQGKASPLNALTSRGIASTLRNIEEPSSSVEVSIINTPELLGNLPTDHKRGQMKARDHQYSLKGSVVLFPEEPLVEANGNESPSDERSAPRLELHYLTELDNNTSSDGEESPKVALTTRTNGNLGKEYATQKDAVTANLNARSYMNRARSPKREIPRMSDPEVERRKFNREFAINVQTRLGQRKRYDRETMCELIEAGVAKHSSLCSSSLVSVTNDVCSASNYEVSHAYFYQQMHRRGKLEYLTLNGPSGTDDVKATKSTSPIVVKDHADDVKATESKSPIVVKDNTDDIKATESKSPIVLKDYTDVKRVEQTNSNAPRDHTKHTENVGPNTLNVVGEYTDDAEKTDPITLSPVRGHTDATAKTESSLSNIAEERSSNISTMPTAISLLKEENKQVSSSREIWRHEWHETLQGCSMYFDSSVSSTLESKEKDKVSKQFSQLMNIFKTKFGVRIAPNFDDNVRILVSYDGQRTNGTTDKFAKNTSEISEGGALGKKLRVWSLTKACQFLKNIGIEPGEWEMEPENSITGSGSSNGRPVEISKPDQKAETTAKEGFEANTVQIPSPLQLSKFEHPNKHTQDARVSSVETVDEKSSDTDIDGEAVDTENYLENVMRHASEAIGHRDKQIEAARRIILALSREVMQKEIEVTSLIGRLKVAESEIQNQKKSIQDYDVILSEKELQIMRMSEDIESDFADRGSFQFSNNDEEVKKGSSHP